MEAAGDLQVEAEAEAEEADADRKRASRTSLPYSEPIVRRNLLAALYEMLQFDG